MISEMTALISNQISHEQLVTRQDILNIQRQLNIDTIQKDSNDLLSVCAWVEELKCLPYNPILAFKPQGEAATAEYITLQIDNFLFVIQSFNMMPYSNLGEKSYALTQLMAQIYMIFC